MRLTLIAYSKVKKSENLVLINNVTHQRETLTMLTEWPIRISLMNCASDCQAIFSYQVITVLFKSWLRFICILKCSLLVVKTINFKKASCFRLIVSFEARCLICTMTKQPWYRPSIIQTMLLLTWGWDRLVWGYFWYEHFHCCKLILEARIV